jgi:hypothetical protein
MTALLVGELVKEDCCLRVGDDLLVWPHGFSGIQFKKHGILK